MVLHPQGLPALASIGTGEELPRCTDEHRGGRGATDRNAVNVRVVELPSDLANGSTLTLLKNIAPDVASTTVSMVAATPKPRLVKLVITRGADEPFSVGRAFYKATRFNVKVEIGGLAGVIAPLLGKQPRDASVWILGGDAPGFVKSESQFYEGGPLWRIELAAPDSPPKGH